MREKIKEIVRDLSNISRLSYVKKDDLNELEHILEAIIKYVNIGVQLCFMVFMDLKDR
ncbi:MAG: hypothetical protein ACTS85_00935 [Arsenophonus sp. NC-PG7-MAG3]